MFIIRPIRTFMHVVEKILLRVSDPRAEIGLRKFTDFARFCLPVEIQRLKNPLYPDINRQCCQVPERKETDTIRDFLADAFTLH